MSKQNLLAFSLFLLAGCATPDEAWHKSGATLQDLALDQSVCNREWTKSLGFGKGGLWEHERACLRKKGWKDQT